MENQIIAITREVSRSIVNCELTHLAHTPIDVTRARAQHEQYREALRSLGLDVISLPEETDLPDSVFVEDAAIVLDEVAALTRPGADSLVNALPVGDALVYPSVFAGTRARLEAANRHIVTVEADELSKAEGGVTCCSLVFSAQE